MAIRAKRKLENIKQVPCGALKLTWRHLYRQDSGLVSAQKVQFCKGATANLSWSVSQTRCKCGLITTIQRYCQ